MSKIKCSLLVGASLLLYWIMAVSVSPRMGVTGDEVVHLTGGYSYWTLNDYRLHPENGNLAQRIAALPLLGINLSFPSLDDPDWMNSKVNLVGEKFFFQEGNPVARMLLASRMMIALAGAFTVWLTWLWARRLFGKPAGWLALALAAFCPTLLAHGGLATSDMVMTACTLGALSTTWRLLHRATWGRLGLAALACGLAFLSKMSGVIIVPIIGILVVLRSIRSVPLVIEFGQVRWIRNGLGKACAATGLAALVAIGSLVVLWAGFGFRYEGFNPGRQQARGYYLPWEVVLSRESMPRPEDTSLNELRSPAFPLAPTGLDQIIEWLRDEKVLPEAYLWGFAQTNRFSRERPAFFMGEHSNHGWVGFFPAAFLLKTSPAAMLLGLAGLGALIGRRRLLRDESNTPSRPWAYRAAPLLVFFGVYWVMALRMNLNIGHRHILPTYPIFYILASASVFWLRVRRWRPITAGLIAVAALHATDSLLARPFYLSYFQPLCGGTAQGYRYLVDSSLDWGQGLPDLERWLATKRSRDDHSTVYLSYFGADSPRARKLDVVRFGDEINDRGGRAFPAQLHGGWYIISATNFVQAYAPTRGPWTSHHEALYQALLARLRSSDAQNPSTEAGQKRLLQDCMDIELLQAARLFTYLKDQQPTELVGGSLLVFKLADADVTQALYGQIPLQTNISSSPPQNGR